MGRTSGSGRNHTRGGAGGGAVHELPAPPALKMSARKQDKYRKEAFNDIPQSKSYWEHAQTAIDPGIRPEPGVTYTQQEFVDFRQTFTKTLTPHETEASLFYSHRGDVIMNGAFRRGEKLHPDVERMSRTLDAVIAKSTVPRDTTVVRAVKGDFGHTLADLPSGTVFRDKGYVSTSAVSGMHSESATTVIHIQIPKGAKAAPIPSASPLEHEYLLPRNTKFKVVRSVRRENSLGERVNTLYVKVVK